MPRILDNLTFSLILEQWGWCKKKENWSFTGKKVILFIITFILNTQIFHLGGL